MKKALLFIIAGLIITGTSCKKDHSKGGAPTSDTDKTYKVSFAVSNFSQLITTFQTTSVQVNSVKTTAAAATGLSSSIAALYYIIYDSNGKFIHMVSQFPSQANFGTVSDNLHSGTYTVVFIGSDDGRLPIDGFNGIDLNSAYIHYVSNVVNQTFFKKLTLNVGTADSNQNVVLERNYGEVQVNIEDAIPQNVSSIAVHVLQDAKSFALASATPYYNGGEERVGSVNLTDADKGKTNFNKAACYAITTTSPLTVEIIAYNSAGVKVADKMVPNVTFQTSKITLLTGKLFGGNGVNSTTGSISLSIDTTWTATPIVKNF